MSSRMAGTEVCYPPMGPPIAEIERFGILFPRPRLSTLFHGIDSDFFVLLGEAKYSIVLAGGSCIFLLQRRILSK